MSALGWVKQASSWALCTTWFHLCKQRKTTPPNCLRVEYVTRCKQKPLCLMRAPIQSLRAAERDEMYKMPHLWHLGHCLLTAYKSCSVNLPWASYLTFSVLFCNVLWELHEILSYIEHKVILARKTFQELAFAQQKPPALVKVRKDGFCF